MGFEPIGVVAARVVRDAQAQGRGPNRTRTVRAWNEAAKAGLTVREAAALLGRDEDEGRRIAARHRFKFPVFRKLPEMSATDRADYRRMQRKGVSRADALAALGLEERLW